MSIAPQPFTEILVPLDGSPAAVHAATVPVLVVAARPTETVGLALAGHEGATRS